MEKVSRERTEDPYWWHKVECHLNPMWRLPDLDQYMVDTIKDTYRFEFNLKILPDFMTIERLLFSAWIEVSHNFCTGESYKLKAVGLVQQANQYLTNNLKKLGDGSLIGYGTIINAFLLWIYHKSGSIKEFKVAEEKLKELWDNASFQSESNTLAPSYQAYIDVTHAWALGLLGSEKRRKALTLLDNALKVRNKERGSEMHWLFAKALIQGRAAREGIDNFQSDAPRNLVQILEKEKQTLEQVTGTYTSLINLAHVHLATVMIVLDDINETDGNAKKDITDKRKRKKKNKSAKQVDADKNAKQNTTDRNDETALKVVKESLSDDRAGNLIVALILSRLNKDLNDSIMLQHILEYCETENNIAPENRSSDVYFQLGLLYYKQSKLNEDETSMLVKALSMVQEAVYRDKNHIQARLWEAMILVNLHKADPKNFEKAKDIFSEIRHVYYKNTATELHILRYLSTGSVRPLYEPLQYLQNVFQFLLLCVKHHVVKDYLGAVNFESFVRKDAHQRMEILREEVASDDEKIKNGAIRYLAQVNFHLERYTEAERLFKMLKNLCLPKELETKEKCGLVKCLYRLGKFQELKMLGEVYDEGDGGTIVKEIQGFVTLAEGKEKQHEMMAKCENAIELGNLDGCLLMLNMHQHFQEKFFAFRERFAHRLAKIRLCMTRDESGSEQASNRGQKQNNKDTIKQMVADKIDAILMYCRRRKVFHESHESVYKKLKEIRRLLYEFEYCLLLDENSCSTKEGFLNCSEEQCNYTKQQLSPGKTSAWSEDCRKAAEAVLTKALFLLDEVIGCLQIAVRGESHEFTVFPTIACWEKGTRMNKKLKQDSKKV